MIGFYRLYTILTLVTCGLAYAAPKAQDKDLEKKLSLKMQAKIPSAQLPAPTTSINVSYNPASEEQAKHVSILDLEIVQLDNELQELQKSKSDMQRQQKLREQISTLRQKKAVEDKLTTYLNQLGALDAALEYNRELLIKIGGEIEQLKNLELENIDKQKSILEKQRRKLEGVLQALELKKNSASLKIAGLNRTKQ